MAGNSAARVPEVSVVIVSYNTRALTIRAIETLLDTTVETPIHVIVFDNASSDGSADAVAERFPAADYPQVELVRSEENLGFARANNVVIERVETPWVLLLNPDTECHAGAVDALTRFSKEHPQAGITGGRTVFPDGSLNIASCWMRITPWSLFCQALGLHALFPRSELFNSEAMGDWKRDSVRRVDIVVGCFLMIPTALWRELGGFDLKYVMYGEEADLCLRAAKMGYGPMITPDAEIMHIVGAASASRADKRVLVARARATLVRDHFPAPLVPVGLGLMWLSAGLRTAAAEAVGLAGRGTERRLFWRQVWSGRRDWLSGY